MTNVAGRKGSGGRVLFVPVSGARGMGEYARALALATAAARRLPQLQVHFIVSREAPYAADLPFPKTLIPASPTMHTAEVVEVIRTFRPTLVVFDNAGRTKQLQAAVAAKTDLPVEICMRYGNPSPKAAMDSLMKRYPDLKEVMLLPLYPHYAMSSYETAVEYAKEIYNKEGYSFKLSIVPPFYKDEVYIDALAESMRPYVQQDFDLMVFSYHGIPERHITKRHAPGTHNVQTPDSCCTDAAVQEVCYRHQVITTTQLVAAKLGLPREKYTLSFQSRLGRDPWLQPYTAKRLAEWPKEGYKKIVLACPAFVSDCLETLEEMGEEGREIFMEAGGESFTLIPCMNTHPKWVEGVMKLVEKVEI